MYKKKFKNKKKKITKFVYATERVLCCISENGGDF